MQIKKAVSSKGFYIFLAGCLFGILLIRPTHYPTIATWVPDNNILEKTIAIPGLVGMFASWVVLHPTCYLVLDRVSEKEWCAGLAFDGSPLEWVEWTFLYLFMALGYGLLFLLIYKLIKVVTRRKNTTSNIERK